MTKTYDQKNAVEGWGTSTQLLYGPPTPYRFQVDAAEFNTDQRRKGKEDTLHLVLHGTPLDVDNLEPIEEWERHSLVLSCGNNWTSSDNGKTAEHPTNEVFDGRSAAGKFVDAIVATPALKSLFKMIRERGNSTDAEVYEGIDITVGQLKQSGTIEGEKREWAVPIPLEYHGLINVEEASERKAKADDELVATLTKLAKESDTHDEFQNEAMTLGVTDSKLLKEITDEGKTGFYEKARK